MLSSAIACARVSFCVALLSFTPCSRLKFDSANNTAREHIRATHYGPPSIVISGTRETTIIRMSIYTYLCFSPCRLEIQCCRYIYVYHDTKNGSFLSRASLSPLHLSPGDKLSSRQMGEGRGRNALSGREKGHYVLIILTLREVTFDDKLNFI